MPLLFRIVAVVAAMAAPHCAATTVLHSPRGADGRSLGAWGVHGTWEPFPRDVPEAVAAALQIGNVNDSGGGVDTGLLAEMQDASCERASSERSAHAAWEPFPIGMVSAFAPTGTATSDGSRSTDHYHYSSEFGLLPGLPVTLAELGPRQPKRQLQPVSFAFSNDVGGRRLAQLPAERPVSFAFSDDVGGRRLTALPADS